MAGAFLMPFYERTDYMKIFSSLFHSRDKPKNSTAGSAYRFYTGGSTAGKNVTERSAMQMTAVYSCVRVLSEAVAGYRCTSISTVRTAARKKRSRIHFTACSTMNRILK